MRTSRPESELLTRYSPSLGWEKLTDADLLLNRSTSDRSSWPSCRQCSSAASAKICSLLTGLAPIRLMDEVCGSLDGQSGSSKTNSPRRHRGTENSRKRGLRLSGLHFRVFTSRGLSGSSNDDHVNRHVKIRAV